MTALKTEDFGCTADVSVVLVKLFQNIVAFVSCARLVQGGELISYRAAAAIAMHQRRQMLPLKAARGWIHNNDALDHVAQFAHVSRPGITHQSFNCVVADFARPPAIGGRKFL